MSLKSIASISLICTTALMGAVPAYADAGTVNIYSYRQPYLIEPLLSRFEEETGIKPVVLFADSGLIERAAAEGENSPADLILTTDIGNLAAAKEAGVYQPIVLDSVAARVPSAYQDPDGAWAAMSLRARVFYASADRVTEEAIGYNDIAGPDWKGRFCTRSGQHVYNIGLVAAHIAHNGVDETREWLAGVRDNLASKPAGGDRTQVKSIFSGACDLAIGNTYYMGLMLNNEEEPEQKDWAAAVRIVFPTFEEGGTHVNVSGVVLTRHAPNKANAEKLIDFLVSDEGQSLYAETNYEYPVVAEVAPSATVAAWGDLVPDPTPLSEIASHRAAASALMDELQFDDGPQN